MVAAARLLAVLAAVALAGCSPNYVFGRVGDLTPPARPADCRFELIEAVPKRPFDELGILAPRDIEYGSTAGGRVSFTESVQATVCAAGGDAVVVEKDLYDHYVRGTVIKYRDAAEARSP
jgi:hypothetical protein